VVVCPGLTVIDPLVDTLDPLMVTEFAPLTFHDSVEDWPAVTVDGLAVNELIVGALGTFAITVTVVCAFTEPVLFAAVKV
jgi:hypothetical protein